MDALIFLKIEHNWDPAEQWQLLRKAHKARVPSKISY